jgi:glucose-1-phosphate cytidylyltransferase
MVKIGGRPILGQIVKLYAQYGLREFVLCLGYKGAWLSRHCWDRTPAADESILA